MKDKEKTMDQIPNSYGAYEDDEREISIRDLLYYVLRHWRSIFLIAVVACILLGGFKVVQGLHALGSTDITEDQKTYERALQEYTISKTRLEEQAEDLAQAMEDKGVYHENSILMNLDPKAAYKSTLTYLVNDTNDAESTVQSIETGLIKNQRVNSILGSYASLIQNGTILREVQEELGTKLDYKYLAELVYVQADYQAKLLHITALGESEEQVSAISDALEESLQEENAKISEAVAPHQLRLISSYSGKDAGTSILIGSVPEDGKNKDTTYQTSIEALQKQDAQEDADLQNQLLDCNKQLSELEKPTAPVGVSKTSALKESMKFAALGFVIGAFLVAAYYGLRYLLSGKLMAYDDLRDYYGLFVLAEYHAPICKKPNAFDRWIDHLNGITEEKSSRDAAYHLAAANIQAQMGTIEKAKLLFVGTAEKKEFNEAISAMEQKLQSAGIETIAAGNVNTEASAIQQLENADQVILIEQLGVTRQQDLEQELQMLRKLGKEILGVIAL